MNCYDEIYPGQHENSQRIQELLNKKIKIGDEKFIEKYSKIISELHQLMKEDYMGISKRSEQEADYYLAMCVNFNHVKTHTMNDGVYLSIDPIIGNKYE